MSEGIVIALITAIGSLLGGIIGQIITSSATIEAAKIKDKVNISQNGENNSWRRVVLGAIVGAVVTLIILFSLGMIPPKSENPPIASSENISTETSETKLSVPEKTSTPSNIATGDSSILFNEDFEDGKTQQVVYSEKEWQIVLDETGNNVYDVDNSKGSGFPRIHLGSNSWKDYEISFRARIISGSWIIIYFRENELTASSYVADIRLDSVALNYTTQGSAWKLITSRQHNLKRNEWYWVNIQAKGSEIKITINDVVIIFTDDTRHTYGRAEIQAGQYTHAQFDDIKVISLER